MIIKTIPKDINVSDFDSFNLNMSSEYYHNLAMNNNPNLLANKLLLDILNYRLVIEGAANKPRVDIEAGVTRSWDFTASSGQADELSIMGRVSVPLNESDQVQMKQRNINLEINRHKRVLDDLEYKIGRAHV